MYGMLQGVALFLRTETLLDRKSLSNRQYATCGAQLSCTHGFGNDRVRLGSVGSRVSCGLEDFPRKFISVQPSKPVLSITLVSGMESQQVKN